MPTPQVVDRFNVDGQEYSIEPVLDPIPTSGSPRAVTSGGVFADKSAVPVKNSTKNFTAAGAFDFFADSETQNDWLSKALAPMMFRKYELWTAFSDFYSAAGVGATFWNAVGDVGYGARQFDQIVVCSLDGGTTWQDTTGLRSGFVRSGDIVYGDSKWLALENNRYIAYSINGKDFFETPIDLNTYTSGYWVAKWVHDRWFFRVRDYNDKYKLYYTTDLQELHLCSTLPSATSGFISFPVYGRGKFVCTVDEHGIYISSDGSYFTQAYSDATKLYGTILCLNGVYSLGRDGYADSGALWAVLQGVNDNSTNWQLVFTDDPTDWSRSIPWNIGPAEDGCIAYEFNETILIGMKVHTAGTSCQGLYALRHVRGSGRTTGTTSAFEVVNLQLAGASFGSVENIGCINGTWFVYSQPYVDSGESIPGWRISNDLEHWELVATSNAGRSTISYWKGRIFFPVRGADSNRKVSSAETLLKEFTKEDKFILQ